MNRAFFVWGPDWADCHSSRRRVRFHPRHRPRLAMETRQGNLSLALALGLVLMLLALMINAIVHLFGQSLKRQEQSTP